MADICNISFLCFPRGFRARNPLSPPQRSKERKKTSAEETAKSVLLRYFSMKMRENSAPCLKSTISFFQLLRDCSSFCEFLFNSVLKFK